MRHKLSLLLTLFIGFLLVPAVILAQAESCPEIVQAALDATDDACDGTSRNQACYGNVRLSAEPQEGIAEFNFSEPGDIVDVAAVQSLTLSSQVEEEGAWGIALMQLQINLPDTLPGQNVTFLLFGDVQITNGVESNTDPVTFEVTAQRNVNVRSGPSTNDAIVGSLETGDAVIAIGRDETGEWFNVELTEGEVGWVSAGLVETTGDISILNITDATAANVPQLNPMQSFYFQSGIGDAPCAEAPDSGILIQTPEGAAQVQLQVNGATIGLGSTVYLQAQPNDDMIISVVEGQAIVTAEGVSVRAPAGTRVRVPLDANGVASGPPSETESYSNDDLAALPVDHLEETVTVATALTESEIDALTTGIISLDAGNACVEGGLTFSHDTNSDTVATSLGGQWTATEGMTVRIVATNVALEMNAMEDDLIQLRESGNPLNMPAFVGSGGSNSLVYTFTSDITFHIWLNGGRGQTLAMTVTCE